MAMQINTNISALNTYRNLTATQHSMSKSLEKLSSGLRINRASDDAAGLVISEGLKSQIGGLNVASRNAQDGISVVQTAEGALGTAQNILQRLRDLGVQAGNDSNSAQARDAISKEASSLTDELTRISQSTNFNGTSLLDRNSANGTLTFQVGADGNSVSQIKVDLSAANLTGVVTGLKTNSTAFAVDTPTAVTGSVTFTDGTKTANVNLGASAGNYKTVQAIADQLNSGKNADGTANTTFVNDFTAAVDGNNKLVVFAKSGASVTVTAPGTGIAAGTASTSAGVDFTSATAAQASINQIDKQLTAVSTARASLGAVQNRFENAVSNISVAVENLSASKSRITDVDMASEMVNYTRAQILSQSGTAMLAQANQGPQLALKLLQ
jgi:flagellin